MTTPKTRTAQDVARSPVVGDAILALGIMWRVYAVRANRVCIEAQSENEDAILGYVCWRSLVESAKEVFCAHSR